ncbi:MAG: hypothetical protein QF473_03945 [Planctomycetota bacterium]|nr:hypothetical protein [Planctomycetota bacterium]
MERRRVMLLAAICLVAAAGLIWDRWNRQPSFVRFHGLNRH